MTGRYRALLDQMAADTLQACDFGHREHIGVAWEAVGRLPFFEALALFARGIQGAAARAGAADKFHATVTLAFLSLIAERAGQGDYRDADDFIDANPDLQAPDVLAPWYSPDRLGMALARSVALMPDRRGGAHEKAE